MSTPSSTPLVVVPCDPRTPQDLDAAARCLVSLWGSAQCAEVVVAGDRAADPIVTAQLQAAADELGLRFEQLRLRASLAGVNPLLFEARDAGRDAVLVAADVELDSEGWLEAMLARRDTSDRLAAIVGGRLLYPDGLIEHAGLQFSLLQYRFVERFRFGPGSLRESRVPAQCPVGPGLLLIRNEALIRLKGLDPQYRGLEVLDLCLRAFEADLECIYEPSAVGTRHRTLDEPETEEAKLLRTGAERLLLNRHQGHVARWTTKVTA